MSAPALAAPPPLLQAASLLDLIGRTPLVRLKAVVPADGAEVWVKCEQYNPGGSVKDRIALAMIDAAERAGQLTPGRSIVVEPTSGNTGIGLALVCAAQRLPPGPLHAGVDVARAARAAAVVRRRDHPHAGAGGHGGRGRARARVLSRQPGSVHAGSVPQPGQPGGAPAHHRARDPGAAGRRSGRRVRLRHRHRRNRDRRGRRAAPAVPCLPRDRRGAGAQRGAVGSSRPARTRSRASAPASCRTRSTARC